MMMFDGEETVRKAVSDGQRNGRDGATKARRRRGSEMNPAILNSQFVRVALPIVLTIFIAAWMNGRSIDGINKRIDDLRSYMTGLHDGLKTDLANLRIDMNSRFGEVNRRLDHIDETLQAHGGRILVLEERTSLLGRRG